MDKLDQSLHQTRKTNKPLTERRRRERINNSLLQLKTLVLRGTNKEDNIKLEKADIMDMTVRYIEDLQHKQKSEDHTKSQLAMNSFIQGYSSCVTEVTKALNIPYVSDDIRYNVSSHLSSSLCALTASYHHQDLNSPSQSFTALSPSDVSDDRMATSTPYSFFLTDDDSRRHHLSPIASAWAATPSDVSPNITWQSTYNSPDTHSENSSKDSGLDNRSIDSDVWRPW